MAVRVKEFFILLVSADSKEGWKDWEVYIGTQPEGDILVTVALCTSTEGVKK